MNVPNHILEIRWNVSVESIQGRGLISFRPDFYISRLTSFAIKFVKQLAKYMITVH